MNSIRTRLEQAQQPGSNFIEPLWYEEAWRELRECHSTYDRERDTWRINKWDRASWTRLTSQPLKNIQADVLVIHSQYDAENPWFIVNAFMSSLATKKKYLRTLPFATHLCIWERARTTLYEWTAEFILL
jgi:hypothetical protein